MKIFITGSSGFIGVHLSKKLLDSGHSVHGFDSMNNYYDVKLKKARYEILKKYKKFSFTKNNLENIKNLLVHQIYSNVRWRESIINMSKEKITDFIEIGPGKVLSGMVKRTVKDINSFSINSIDDIKKVI